MRGEFLSLLFMQRVILGLYVVEEFPLPDELSQSEVIEVFVGDEDDDGYGDGYDMHDMVFCVCHPFG